MRSEKVWKEQIETETRRFIDEKEVSRITGFAVQTLRNHRFRGVGFPYYRAFHRIKYRLSDILSYMEERRVEPLK